MKIQILISKSSWANKYKKNIISHLSNYSKNIKIFNDHKNLKKDYDINIIFSYFKIIPKKYLIKSKVNLVPHESNLPLGKGMSPLTWQILKNKKRIYFSLIEASSSVDSGKIYFKKRVIIPKSFLFDEIKKIQFKENLKLILKFIKIYKKSKKIQLGQNQKGESTFYKKRTPIDSEINIKKSIISQFNLFRVVDNKNYPAFFKLYGKKYYLRINKK